MKKGTIFLSQLLFFCFSVYGQRFATHVFDKGNGMPIATVYGIAQGEGGYLWAACRNGIARYDGRNWRLFSTEDGLETIHFQQICADQNGMVWAATNHIRRGVAYYQDKRWRHIEEELPVQMNGALFFQTFLFEEQIVPVIGNTDTGFWYHLNHVWHLVDPREAFPYKATYGMAKHGDQLYLATDNGPLIFSDKGLDTRLVEILPDENRLILAIAPEVVAQDRLRLWLLGENWLGYIQSGQFNRVVRVPVPSIDTQYVETRLKPDGRNGVFFGDRFRLWYYSHQSGKLSRQGVSTGMKNKGVTSFLIDREQSLWIASLRGLTQIPDRSLVNYFREDGLLEDEVSAILEWQPDLLLFGHDLGLTLLRGGKTTTLTLSHLREENRRVMRVMDLRHGPNGSVLAALHSGGVVKWDSDLKQQHYPMPDNIQANSVYYDKAETTWVASSKGIFTLDEGIFHSVEAPTKKALHYRRVIPGSQDQKMFTGVGAGLLVYDGAWRRYTGPDNRANSTYACFQDPSDKIWVGSISGLFTVQDKRLVRPESDAFQLERAIYFLLGDGQGGLWAGTDDGFFHLSPNQKPRQFTVRHGLPGFETNRGAGMIDDQGDLWVGTDRGLSHSRPDLFISQPLLPIPGFSYLEINGQRFPANQAVELDDWRNDITFHYKNITMRGDLGVQFQSRLEGYEPQWSETFSSEDRQARYINLPMGKYRFQIRARLQDNPWSESISTETIVIPKPPSQRWWFRLLAISVPLVLIYLGLGYISSKRNSRKLEKQVWERTAKLEMKIQDHRASEARYQELSKDLEQRVKDRTAELEAMQKERVENAHYAGMAEIATSVLHNVGNILNSISTAGYLLNETLDKSRVATMERANVMLEDNLDDIVNFLKDDPRGINLLKLYLVLGKRFRGENEKQKQQLGLMLERIQTIKDVVSQQHNYTSNLYQTEELRLQSQVEKALIILEEGMAELGVKVDVFYEDVPHVLVQKTKLTHILVNILKNARESVQLSGYEDGAIHISLVRESAFVVLSIKDTGIGIHGDDLPKIFAHGFTTKPTGHGFGLHSCAIAMKEMGGTIDVRSEGVGRGATFVLRFPVAPAVRVVT